MDSMLLTGFRSDGDEDREVNTGQPQRTMWTMFRFCSGGTRGGMWLNFYYGWSWLLREEGIGGEKNQAQHNQVDIQARVDSAAQVGNEWAWKKNI